MKRRVFPLVFATIILLTAFTPYQEPYRPRIHYTPFENWMNDPNGLVYDEENGIYHMFYQYCTTLEEDQMQKHWGHATSKDLVFWEEQDVALSPDEFGSIWSGSCVIDENNTSGLFGDETPPKSRMVALFTYAGGDTELGFEKQGLAYSTDFGKSFVKYKEPVIKNGNNEYSDGFRDPKVIWHEDSRTWLMVIGGGPVRLFASKNLVDWEFNSILKYKDGSNIVSECPDFFPMKVENRDETKWVFLGAGRFYVTGDLTVDEQGKFHFKATSDRQTFVSDNTPMYAAQTFFNDSKDRRIAIYWLIDLFSKTIDSGMGKIWDGVQSLPLELKLFNMDGNYVIKANPVEEVAKLRIAELFSLNNVFVGENDENILNEVRGRVLEIEAVVDVSNAGRVNVVFGKGNDERTVLSYNARTQNLALVFKDSGISSDTISVKVPVDDGKIKLRIIVDNTVVDVFANDGLKVLSGHFYSSGSNDGLEFSVENGEAEIEYLKIYELFSIWTEPKFDEKQDEKHEHNGLKTLDYILIVAAVTFAVCITIITIAIRMKRKEGA